MSDYVVENTQKMVKWERQSIADKTHRKWSNGKDNLLQIKHIENGQMGMTIYCR